MTSKVTRSSNPKSGGQPAVQPCECCGIAPGVDGKPLSITFELPDVYYDIPPELLSTWGQDPFLAIKDVGFFIRVILPVEMTGGFAVNYGTWLEVHSETFRTAWQTWNQPKYKDLEIEGFLCNIIEPLPTFPHAMVKATVREMDEVPYITSASHQEISAFLGMKWPHARFLAPWADLLRGDLPELASAADRPN